MMRRYDRTTTGWGWGARLRYALADLWFHRGTTAILLAAVTLAELVLLLAGYYGERVYRYQKAQADDGLAGRVVVACRDADDTRQRFTPERLAEAARVAGRPVVPRRELGVRVSLGTGTPQLVAAESVTADDPAVGAALCAWGAGADPAGEPGAVVSASLWRKLGGRLTAAGPSPAELRLEVGRTSDGREQLLTLTLPVRGIVQLPAGEKCYLPLDVVDRLDRWCASKVADWAGNADALGEVRELVGFGPAERTADLPAELGRLDLAVEATGRLTHVVADGPIWLRADGDAAVVRGLAGRSAGVSVHAVRVLDVPGRGRVAALADDDPRWPPAVKPAFDQAAAVPGVGADLGCRPDTLAWWAFDPARTPLTEATLVRTRDAGVVNRLAGDWRVDEGGAAVLLRVAPEVIDRVADWAEQRYPGRWGFAYAGESVRYLPAGFLAHTHGRTDALLADAIMASGAAPCRGRPVGVALWGELPDAARLANELSAARGEVAEELRLRCRLYSRLFMATPDVLDPRFTTPRAACELTPITGVASRRLDADRTRPVFVVPAREPAGRADAPPLTLMVNGAELRLRSRPAPAGSADVVSLDPDSFKRLLFEQSRAHLSPAGREEMHLRVPAAAYSRLREAAAAAEVDLTPLTAVREENLNKYRIRRRDGGPLEPELVASLAFLRPLLVSALPAVEEAGRCGDGEVSLTGTAANDPRGVDLIAGSWPAADGEVVLPADLVARLWPGELPARAVGRRTTIRFERPRTHPADAGPLVLPVRLAGVAERGAWAPAETVRRVAAWRARRLVYDDASGRFTSPADQHRDAGYSQAVTWAAPADAALVVERLEAAGFRCEHRLAEQAALGRLAQVLTALVSLAAGGALALAALTVGVSTTLMIGAKRWEIGLLAAHGAAPGHIVSLYALQGLALGLAAAVTGWVTAAALEPFCSRLITLALPLPDDLLAGRLAVSLPLWLSALAAALALGVALAGATVPAARASRLSPVDALQPTD